LTDVTIVSSLEAESGSAADAGQSSPLLARLFLIGAALRGWSSDRSVVGKRFLTSKIGENAARFGNGLILLCFW
jgi:hypothetical protein